MNENENEYCRDASLVGPQRGRRIHLTKIGLHKKTNGKKCKLRLGQFVNGKLILTDKEKLTMIKDFLSGKETRTAVYYPCCFLREKDMPPPPFINKI